MNDNARTLHASLIRNLDEAALARDLRAPLYDTFCARLAGGTAANRLGASIDLIAPGMRANPYHFHHAQEELFVVLDGEGTLRVAGESLPLRTGDVVFVPPGPDYPHQIVNTSTATLKILSVSTRDPADVCEYPDSGKFAAIVPSRNGPRFHAVHPMASGVDYWDGEP